MAVKTREEIISAINERLAGDSSDEALALIEDISDTLDSLDGEGWKKKYEDNDKSWRKRYKERFLNTSKKDDDDIEDDDDDDKGKTKLTFENLFKEG